MQKTKSVNKKIALLLEIIGLAATISESKENPAHVFVNYSGHVDEVRVYGYTKGYGQSDWDIDYDLYMNDSDATDKLIEIKKYLTELLNK